MDGIKVELNRNQVILYLYVISKIANNFPKFQDSILEEYVSMASDYLVEDSLSGEQEDLEISGSMFIYIRQFTGIDFLNKEKMEKFSIILDNFTIVSLKKKK